MWDRIGLIGRAAFDTTAVAIMSHESVWNSRPRTYGKGARAWYVIACILDYIGRR